MTKIKALVVSALAAGLLLGPQSAQAHCDSADGPVAAAAQKALDTGNINLALPYAQAAAEAELRAAFARSLKVRTLSADAKALADRAFIETTVRLHRASEGAAYTGLKPAGTDFGPAIPAAERAVETGDLSQVRVLLVGEIEHALHERLADAREARKASKEPKTADQVEAARKRVRAEFAFVGFVESLRQAAHGEVGHKE
ncbi:MAG: hypothetical protein F9K29_17550 [Hyphomicrobiaceae bacterium]|nr:MAG: hypothetical protein F9K29_17550 [Hyphomicrobiaceae bacterium]